MEDEVHLDFETRSTLPFGRQGGVTAYQYARHDTTDIWCMSWAINDEEVSLWDPWGNDPFPDDLVHALRQGVKFTAHNAGFEYQIWNNVLAPRWGVPYLPIEQMDCTAARAAAMALPRSLEGAGAALGLPIQKDEEGHRLMMRMAKPRKPRKGEDPEGVYWWDDPPRRKRLGEYCIRDTETERELGRVVLPLSKSERKVWLYDHKTNMHGVVVDTDFARRAQKVMGVLERRYCEKLELLTAGAVKAPTEVGNIKDWMASRGVDTDSIAKGVVLRLMDDPKVPEDVKEVLQVRQEAGKSSVAKYVRFEQLTSEDGRMRENFMYHGANTGRLSGKGAQLQNLPSRGGLSWEEADVVIQAIKEIDDPEWAAEWIELMFGEVPTALSSCLRGTIIAPPGKKLYVADYSNIEGRVAAWLGGEREKLRAFEAYDRGEGPDLYKVTAGGILGVKPEQVNSIERDILGKISELALGFGGGVGAYQSMAKGYNVDMAEYWDTIQASLDEKYISKAWDNWHRFGAQQGVELNGWLASEAVKLGWRERHPGIVQAWYDAEETAKKALRRPGRWFSFAEGKCAHGAREYGGVMFLISRLPSGRRTYRAHAALRPVTKYGRKREEIRFYGVDGDTRQWVRMSTYGGDLFQTFVQAIARDIMINGWANVEEDDTHNFDVNLSVHDEVGAEADEDVELDHFIKLMTRTPSWAAGCPISAAGYKADRYRKD